MDCISPSCLPPFLSFPYHRLYFSILPLRADAQGELFVMPVSISHARFSTPFAPASGGQIPPTSPMAFILLWVAIQARTNGVCPCHPETRLNKLKIPLLPEETKAILSRSCREHLLSFDWQYWLFLCSCYHWHPLNHEGHPLFLPCL